MAGTLTVDTIQSDSSYASRINVTSNVAFSSPVNFTGGMQIGGQDASFGGMRNRIINGGMQVAQRGTSPTMTGGGDYSLDRFGHYYSSGAVTTSQSSTAPAGFTKSLLITVSTAASSPTYNFFYQKIEGLNCTDLGFGSATASPVTLSFWVRSSVTGIYSVSISNYDGDRAYAAQYTINAANTWEQKIITIPGDTTGTWYTNNSVGLYVRWNMGSASASRLISAGSWQVANADGATGSTGANTWVNTLGATFYITGVQLEKGSAASPFEHRQYGQELALCQRYYYRLVYGVAGGEPICTCAAYNSTLCFGVVQFPVSMRSAPDIDQIVSTGHYFNTGIGASYSFTHFAYNERSTTAITIYNNTSTTATSGAAYWFRSNSSYTGQKLAFTAEL